MIFFEIFPWNKNFETGIELIDEQHKKLVGILNTLAANLANRSGDIIMNDIFDELASYADYHFKAEEKIWFEYLKDDEWSREHKNTHNSFIEEVMRIKENKDDRPLDDVVYDIVSFLSKWLAYHILDTDKCLAIAVRKIKGGSEIAQAKKDALHEMSGSMKVIIDTVLTMYDTLSTRTLDLMREKSLRQKAEEELKISEERFNLVTDTSAENVWDWDIEHNKIDKSEDAFSIYDISSSNIKGNKGESVIHPSDIEQVRTDFQAHLNGKTEFYTNKHRLLHKNGSWSWILSRGKVVSRDKNGKALRMIGTHTDVTERELAALIHKNSSQAMFISDANNIIISINPAFTLITGYTEDEIIGKGPSFISSGENDKHFYKEMWRELKETNHWSGKIANKRKSGEIFTEFLEINAVTDSKGNIDHYIALFNDITKEEKHKKERQEQEEYLLQQSRMAQMGEMISMIAHQWKQPLNSIGLTSGSMQMKLLMDKFDLEQEEQREECIKDFTAELKHIDDLLQNLSNTMDDFRHFYNPNRQRSLELIQSPVIKALYIIKASLSYDGIEVDESYNSESIIDMYENEIIQVVLNILKNAQDNFKERKIIKPKITISTQNSEKGSILTICDNGGGIEEDVLQRVFEPYFSTKSERSGTGLGLYMSKTIIELHHNGKFYATNIKNEHGETEGVCFVIDIASH